MSVPLVSLPVFLFLPPLSVHLANAIIILGFLEMYQTPSSTPQVPIHASILGNVSTQKAPFSASAVGVMPARVVKLTSMNVCPCPARMMPLVSTASESSLASACQVLRPVQLYRRDIQ